jgi:DNA-binding transcriptional LysR family regulator
MTDAQLHALVAVADQGSFTGAARQLRISQSAISHAITALEGSLKVSLLVRSARGVELTPVGRRTVIHARQVLSLKARIREDADATRSARHGTLRVGSFGPTASRRLLPPILERLARAYPGITVQVLEGSDPEIQQWLRDGIVDVGFVTLPSDEFDTTRIAEDEMLAVLPAGHALAAQSSVRPAQLAGSPFIMSTGGCEPAIEQILSDSSVDVRFRIREVQTILDMVARAAGVSIKPTLALPEQLPDGIIVRLLEPPQPRVIGLAVRKRSDATPATRAFLRIAMG